MSIYRVANFERDVNRLQTMLQSEHCNWERANDLYNRISQQIEHISDDQICRHRRQASSILETFERISAIFNEREVAQAEPRVVPDPWMKSVVKVLYREGKYLTSQSVRLVRKVGDDKLFLIASVLGTYWTLGKVAAGITGVVGWAIIKRLNNTQPPQILIEEEGDRALQEEATYICPISREEIEEDNIYEFRNQIVDKDHFMLSILSQHEILDPFTHTQFTREELETLCETFNINIHNFIKLWNMADDLANKRLDQLAFERGINSRDERRQMELLQDEDVQSDQDSFKREYRMDSFIEMLKQNGHREIANRFSEILDPQVK